MRREQPFFRRRRQGVRRRLAGLPAEHQPVARRSIIEVDGDRAVIITEELIAGVGELSRLAQAARADFHRQAAKDLTLITLADSAEAAAAWRLARAALDALLGTPAAETNQGARP